MKLWKRLPQAKDANTTVLLAAWLSLAFVGWTSGLAFRAEDLPDYDDTVVEDEVGGVVEPTTDPPEFLFGNRTILVHPEGRANISCQVNKLGDHQIIWSRKPKGSDTWVGLRIGDTPLSIPNDHPRIRFHNDAMLLVIVPFKEDVDDGIYKCQLSKSSAIYMTVTAHDDQDVVGTPAKDSSSASGASTLYHHHRPWSAPGSTPKTWLLAAWQCTSSPTATMMALTSLFVGASGGAFLGCHT